MPFAKWHAELLTLLPSSTVHELKTKAQHEPLGNSASDLSLLEETGIEDGECLTALVVPPQPLPQLAATRSAEMPCGVMEVMQPVTWGNAADGGDRW